MSRKKKNKINKKSKQLLKIITIIILLAISTIFGDDILNTTNENTLAQASKTSNNSTILSNQTNTSTNISIEDIPEYTDKIYIEINNNKPYFQESEYTKESFENYSQLDNLGRCGVAYANISKETMPPEGDERGSISNVKPTGWKQAKYNGEYLYNRCHLIGYQLSDEDANELNLITGTRYFNVNGMLPFENKVAEYIKQNENNHVLYRVTPIFEGENLLATGVEMEAYSIEDNGQGVCFNVFVYNVEPGITINYKTGESSQNN